MGWSLPNVSRTLTVAGLVGLAALSGVPARGQHTADPYNPYNQEYDSYVYSQFPTQPGLVPNQQILEGRGGGGSANQFQNYMSNLDTFGAEDNYGPRRTGPGVAYYSAYRRYDRDYDRYYQPNQLSNQAYYQDQQARNEKYLAYLRERDPKRRSQLFREYTQSSRRATRDLSMSRTSLSRVGSAPRTGSPSSPETGVRPKSTAPEGAARLARPAARRGSSVTPSPSAPSSTLSPTEILRRSRESGRRPGLPGTGTPATPAPR